MLQRGIEVNQQVAADQQVDPGNRRVVDDVVTAEDDAFPQVAMEDVVAVDMLEVFGEQIGRNTVDFARRIRGAPRRARGLTRDLFRDRRDDARARHDGRALPLVQRAGRREQGVDRLNPLGCFPRLVLDCE